MEFMERQQKEEGTDAKAILAGLVAIGFTDERMQVRPPAPIRAAIAMRYNYKFDLLYAVGARAQSPVAELSGGWRMKLAIATAVTQKCDLLLLDEPTNHLDVASVQWLAEYLVTLKNTTCCIVSHDYAFLRKTCTDVMHIANLVRRRRRRRAAPTPCRRSQPRFARPLRATFFASASLMSLALSRSRCRSLSLFVCTRSACVSLARGSRLPPTTLSLSLSLPRSPSHLRTAGADLLRRGLRQLREAAARRDGGPAHRHRERRHRRHQPPGPRQARRRQGPP